MLTKRLTGIIALALAWPGLTIAAMSSTQYYIYSDSIGVDGGSFSSSTNYSLTDTIGEGAVGNISSASYELRGGFQNMERGTLSISLSDSDISIGTLSMSEVRSANTSVTVTSEAASGYTLSISNVSGSGLTAVSDGVVTAGSSEYGVAVSGSNRAFSNDQAVSSGLVLASSNAPAYDDTTTLTFKASFRPGEPTQSYSQALTLLVTAN